eukprot:ctg_1042.g385
MSCPFMHPSEGEESAALSGTDAGDRPEWSVSPARSPDDSERARGVDTVKLPVWGQGHTEASSGIPYFTGMGSLRPRTGPAPTASFSATAVTAEPTDLPEEQNQGYWRDVEDGDGGVGEADDAESATHDTGADGEVSTASPWPWRGTRQARQAALARRMLRQAEDEIGSEWCSVVSSGWSSHTEGEESDARDHRPLAAVDNGAAVQRWYVWRLRAGGDVVTASCEHCAGITVARHPSAPHGTAGRTARFGVHPATQGRAALLRHVFAAGPVVVGAGAAQLAVRRGGARRNALHHRAPSVRAVVQATRARAGFGASTAATALCYRGRCARRLHCRLRQPHDEPGIAPAGAYGGDTAPVGGADSRAGDYDAAGVSGFSRLPVSGVGFPVVAVSSAGGETGRTSRAAHLQPLEVALVTGASAAAEPSGATAEFVRCDPALAGADALRGHHRTCRGRSRRSCIVVCDRCAAPLQFLGGISAGHRAHAAAGRGLYREGVVARRGPGARVSRAGAHASDVPLGVLSRGAPAAGGEGTAAHAFRGHRRRPAHHALRTGGAVSATAASGAAVPAGTG